MFIEYCVVNKGDLGRKLNECFYFFFIMFRVGREERVSIEY